MNPPFVKKFDFRGEYGKDIKDSDAYYLAQAVAQVLNPQKVLLGWDTRESSKNLALNFIYGLNKNTVEISYMDKCPIDYVTSAASSFDFDVSIMFTGSHNPWTWTGLLIHTKGGDSIQGEIINQIIKDYTSLSLEPYEPEEIDILKFHDFTEEIETVYGEKIKSLIPLQEIKEGKVLVDIGDGSGTKSLNILEKLLPQVKFVRIHDRNIYDNNSAHVADPSDPSNMQDLMDKMKTGEFSCGFAFDSDADRVLAVDENGNYLNGSLLGSLHIESLIALGLTDKKFGYAVDCGTSIQNTISDLNALHGNLYSVVPLPVGRSLVRHFLREGVDLGVENVGHFYSKDFFMTDSGTFSIAVILYWLSKHNSLSQVSTLYPDGLRGQISWPRLDEYVIEKIVEMVNSEFSQYKMVKINIDGIRFDFYENEKVILWYTIRQSGYEKITKCYFGSKDDTIFKNVSAKFKSVVKK